MRRPSNRHAPAIVGIGWLVCTALVGALVAGSAERAVADAPDPTEPTWPLVVWTTDPAHEATVVWTTREPVSEAAVVHRPGARSFDILEHGVRTASTRTLHSPSAGRYFHHVRLTGLHAATDYDFRVVSGDSTSDEMTFRTAPTDARPFHLLYGGDSRTGHRQRKEMNRLIRRLFEKHSSLLAFAHGGDYIVDGRQWHHWEQWLEDWQLTRTESGRVIPLIPARGNHDRAGDNFRGRADFYNAIFGNPGGSRRDYWTTELGANFLLVTLDTNRPHGGRQREWLADRLAEAEGDYRWLVAQYHRAAYPAVKRPGAARTHWVPLFEEFGVDLAMESDGHVLKRTVPILEDEQHPDGVVYLGEGGLGVPQRRPRKERWYLQSPGMTRPVHHVQLVRVGPDAIEYHAIGENGDGLDRATFEHDDDSLPPLAVESVEIGGPQQLHVRFDAGLNRSSLTTDNFRAVPEGDVAEVHRHPVYDDIAVVRFSRTLPEEVTHVEVREVESLASQRLAGVDEHPIGDAAKAPRPDETESKDESPDAPPRRDATVEPMLGCATSRREPTPGLPATAWLALVPGLALLRRLADDRSRR